MRRLGRVGHSMAQRVLFWNGAILVDARFESHHAHVRRRTARPGHPASKADWAIKARRRHFRAICLRPHLEPMTVRYAIGPQAYRMSGGVLPANLVDFDRSAEVVTAQYNALGGTGTLTVINYPDSDIAVEQERAIQAYFSCHGNPAESMDPGADRQQSRSNPDASLGSAGERSPQEVCSGGAAQDLLQRVHYEVSVTIRQPRPTFLRSKNGGTNYSGCRRAGRNFCVDRDCSWSFSGRRPRCLAKKAK